jgi:hypothetical protein
MDAHKTNYERRAWTAKEDDTIGELVRKHGLKKWSIVATELKQRTIGPARTGKQCRTRCGRIGLASECDECWAAVLNAFVPPTANCNARLASVRHPLSQMAKPSRPRNQAGTVVAAGGGHNLPHAEADRQQVGGHCQGAAGAD